jgi:hypothetical protein
LTVKQADNINIIFEKQKATIIELKSNIAIRDSLLALKDTLLVQKIEVIKSFNHDYELAKRLDVLESWIFNAAVEGAWIYYSWEDSTIYSVDLSQYYVKKDNMNGDLYFYKCPVPMDPYERKEAPLKGWERDIVKPERPKVTKVPIKL